MEHYKHYKECIEYTTKIDKEIADYQQKYPNYCKTCGGWGVFVSRYDPSPSGISLGYGYMYDVAFCPECLEKGICPRCGAVIGEFEGFTGDEVCLNCGWKEGDEGIPYKEFNCICDFLRWEKENEK